MFQFKMGYLAAVPAGLMAFSSIAGAQGTAVSLPPSAVVRYGDLNLSTESGISTLNHRLLQAAKKVCPSDGRDLADFTRARACETDAFNRAVHAVGGPALALVEGKRRIQG
jgi:UrcA family protein